MAEHGNCTAPVGGHHCVEGGGDSVPEGFVTVGEHGQRVVQEFPDDLMVGVHFLNRRV